MSRGSDVSGAAETLPMFSVATVFLLLASLVAAAGFAVVAQRRLRQLGMLAAVGATEKHLRLVLLTNGAVVGTIAAFIGTIAGLALWVVFAPTLESAVDHRIDRLSLPWALIAMAIVLASRRGNGRCLVARANGRPPPRHARALGATAQAEARTPLGDRGRSADCGRHRLSRSVRPGQAAAHHRRARGNDPRRAAPGPAGDSPLCPGGRARPDRRALGAARPRPLPGPLRCGTRRHHPRSRYRRDRRHHRGGRGEAVSRRTAQPVRPADPRVHRCYAGAGPSSRSRRPPSSNVWLPASADSRQVSTTRP